MDVLAAHRSALKQFSERVEAIHPSQWHSPTPDTDWDVSALVDHLVTEQLWVPDLLAGRTVAEISQTGDFGADGDNLGDDPKAAWAAAAERSQAAWVAEGAIDRSVLLSRGPTPAAGYCWELIFDLVVHSWDLAAAIGGSHDLPNDLVSIVLEQVRPMKDMLAGSGMFAPAIDVPGCTDDLTELLALTGRNRYWRPADAV